MIAIKIIDYIADSMEVPELVSQISELTVVSNNIMRINNFESILEYSEDKISIALIGTTVVVSGEDLNINIRNDQFLQINGKIFNISFCGVIA